MIEHPGIYTLTMDEYQADPCPAASLSSGIAKLLVTRTPRHAWHAHPRLNPNYRSQESSKFDYFSACHALLLEGEDRMAVIQANDWRTNAAKAERDDARAVGKFPILAHQRDQVFAMRDAMWSAIAANPDFGGRTLLDGKPEQTMIWQEGSTWCRARPDWWSHDKTLMLDYKGTEGSADPSSWIRTALTLGYDIQNAHYCRGAWALDAPRELKFVFAVQEDTDPFACSFVALDPAFLALATEKIEDAIAIWQKCVTTNQWPGYPSRICYVEPPAWEVTRYAERQAERGIAQSGEAYGKMMQVKETDPAWS